MFESIKENRVQPFAGLWSKRGKVVGVQLFEEVTSLYIVLFVQFDTSVYKENVKISWRVVKLVHNLDARIECVNRDLNLIDVLDLLFPYLLKFLDHFFDSSFAFRTKIAVN